MQRVPQPDTERANLTQPAERAPIPSIVGYYNDQEILFVHTEASNEEVGPHLTKMSGSPVVVVPALADIPDGAVSDV